MLVREVPVPFEYQNPSRLSMLSVCGLMTISIRSRTLRVRYYDFMEDALVAARTILPRQVNVSLAVYPFTLPGAPLCSHSKRRVAHDAATGYEPIAQHLTLCECTLSGEQLSDCPFTTLRWLITSHRVVAMYVL